MLKDYQKRLKEIRERATDNMLYVDFKPYECLEERWGGVE